MDAVELVVAVLQDVGLRPVIAATGSMCATLGVALVVKLALYRRKVLAPVPSLRSPVLRPQPVATPPAPTEVEPIASLSDEEIEVTPAPVEVPVVEKPRRTGVAYTQGKRAEMCDAHMVLEQSVLIAGIFDGCGGARAAHKASTVVSELLTRSPRFDLVEALRYAEEQVIQTARRQKWPDATTGVVARVEHGRLEVAWIGDSRCILAQGNVAVPLTRDHNASEKSEEQRVRAAGGRVGRTAAEAKASKTKRVLGKMLGSEIAFKTNRNNPKRVYPGGITLTRAIGGLPLKRNKPQLVLAEPEAAPAIELTADHPFLLLASDGLFESLTSQQAVDTVAATLAARRGHPTVLQDAAQAALVKAQKDGSNDNITVIVVDLAPLHNSTLKST